MHNNIESNYPSALYDNTTRINNLEQQHNRLVSFLEGSFGTRNNNPVDLGGYKINEPIPGIEYDSKKRAKAIREAQVRTSIRMRPGYRIITDSNDPRLHCSNKKIKNPQDFDVVEMSRTLVALHLIAGGVGLAAPQIGWNVRACAVALMDENDIPTKNTVVLYNPRIIGATSMEESNIEYALEGCLSVPGVTAEVCRIKSLNFRASTFQHPKEREYTASGLFARCLQHEVSHLKGKLFLDEQFVRDVKREVV